MYKAGFASEAFALASFLALLSYMQFMIFFFQQTITSLIFPHAVFADGKALNVYVTIKNGKAPAIFLNPFPNSLNRLLTTTTG